MGEISTFSQPSFIYWHAAGPLSAPPCPFCQSHDTEVIGHNGVLGAITLCRCKACSNEWPEAITEDPDDRKAN